VTHQQLGITRGLLAASCVASTLFGVIVGYLLAGSTATGVAPAAYAPPAAGAQVTPAAGIVNDSELQAYRNILASDPKNAGAATELGNKLYDAGRYLEAIAYYQQAFALDPKNVNLSTDLGTALWYTGRADEALAQFQKSLAIDPVHAQTLFNQGIVRLEGKQDALGAIEAWQTLLAKNPSYPDADKVRRLVNEAQQKLVPLAASRAR
jgi:tetratricopeptide (TPR) repeat protein